MNLIYYGNRQPKSRSALIPSTVQAGPRHGEAWKMAKEVTSAAFSGRQKTQAGAPGTWADTAPTPEPSRRWAKHTLARSTLCVAAGTLPYK